MAVEVGTPAVRYGARGSEIFSVEIRQLVSDRRCWISGPDKTLVLTLARLRAERWEAVSRASPGAPPSALNWKSLSTHQTFDTPEPVEPLPQPEPAPVELPPPPSRNDARYQPVYAFLDRLFPWQGRRKRERCEFQLSTDMRLWEETCARIESENQYQIEAHREREERHRESYAQALAAWQAERDAFAAAQHSGVDVLRARFEAGDAAAVIGYFDLVLSSVFDGEYELDVRFGELVVNCALAQPGAGAEQGRSGYQLALDVIGALFRADTDHVLQSVVFNGVVERCICLLTVRCPYAGFETMGNAGSDAESSFRALGGVSRTEGGVLQPVRPLAEPRPEDERFDAPPEALRPPAGRNLATVGWSEFERTINIVFQAVFATRSTDAARLDPAPGLSGELVIEARRTAAALGAAEVQPIFERLQAEGGSKLILVSTSDFDNSAREFAAGRPITLIDGQGLVRLLREYGVEAYIDPGETQNSPAGQMNG